jgi:hypothetical protein
LPGCITYEPGGSFLLDAVGEGVHPVPLHRHRVVVAAVRVHAGAEAGRQLEQHAVFALVAVAPELDLLEGRAGMSSSHLASASGVITPVLAFAAPAT